MKITRVWAMPSKETFKIKPIKLLLEKYVGDGRGWIDPFAGNNSPAEFTNDLNPNTKARNHLNAKEFCDGFKKKLKGVLFDPPYSYRQVKECYEGIGIKPTQQDTQSRFYNKVMNAICNRIKVGGYSISFGWNSSGFGKNRGFKIIEILLIAHGGHHNDTICVVEQKVQSTLRNF